jgi:hypothetical protein
MPRRQTRRTFLHRAAAVGAALGAGAQAPPERQP